MQMTYECKRSKLYTMFVLSVYFVDILLIPFQLYYFDITIDSELFIKHRKMIILLYVIPLIINCLFKILEYILDKKDIQLNYDRFNWLLQNGVYVEVITALILIFSTKNIIELTFWIKHTKIQQKYV